MPSASRSPAATAIARNRAASTPPVRAKSDAWMVPPATTDPTYADTAAAAAWAARIVALGKARRAKNHDETNQEQEQQP